MTTPSVEASEIVSARLFDVPREKLFRAFSEPEELARWWGPQGFTNTFEQFDLRPGGRWQFVMHAPDGTDYPNAKEFIEVSPPERVVFRHVQHAHGFTMTMTFVEVDGKTHLTWRMRFESLEEAERVRKFVEAANEENLDRLAAHVASMA